MMKKTYDSNIPLGKKTHYPDLKNSSLLFAIARSQYRSDLPLCDTSFQGLDIWNSYEFSWLDKETGWPVHGHLRLIFDSTSSHIIESKSLKLYLGSYANSLLSLEEILESLSEDLSEKSGKKVQVSFEEQNHPENLICWQQKNIEPLENFKSLYGEFEFFFKGFKSLCPVTSSPDYATVFIKGQCKKPLDSQEILEYLLSFAQAQEFHEHCIESIIQCLCQKYSLEDLTVIGYFTRRGSLDINPMRTTLTINSLPKWTRQALN